MATARLRRDGLRSMTAAAVLLSACSTTDGERTAASPRPPARSVTPSEARQATPTSLPADQPAPPVDGTFPPAQPPELSAAPSAPEPTPPDSTSTDGFRSGPYVDFAATNELITERQALEWWPYGLMRPPPDISFDHVSLIAGSGGDKEGRENDPATDACGMQLFYERGGSTASDAPYLELLRAGSVLVTIGWLPPDKSKQYVSYGAWAASARNQPVTVRGQAGAMGQYKESNVRQMMWDKPHKGGWLLWTVQVSMDRYSEEQTLDFANRLEEYGKRQ